MAEFQSVKELSVALLIDDIEDTKKVSDSLRDLGVFAHFYQELDELWVALNTQNLDLCLIDIKKTSQDMLSFKQHPKVKNKSLKYALIYKDSTKFLMQGARDLYFEAAINSDMNLAFQLQNLIRRRLEFKNLEENFNTLNSRIDRLKLRGKRLTEEQEALSTQSRQMNELSAFIKSMGRVDSVEEFLNRVISSFSKWDNCIEFGIYQLNSTGQKLVSPLRRMDKYRNLPDLWLTRAGDLGIEEYAQEMINDVCYGLMGDELVSLNITGINDLPDILLVGRFEGQSTNKMDWSMLEMKLSAEYRGALASTYMRDEKRTYSESIFTMMQNMDDILFHRVDSEHRYLMIDFSNLVSTVRQRTGNRFHWKAFYQEFSSEMAQFLHGDFRIASYGAEGIFVAIDKKFIEMDFQGIKAFVEDFQVWRYFEDSALLVSQDLTPSMKFIAPASANVLRHVHGDALDFMQDALDSQRPHLEV